MSETDPNCDKIWTVSELNRLVKGLLEKSIAPLWVKGEVSNLTIHRSGHVYFSIKDQPCQLSCVFFRGATKAQELGLRNGTKVELQGSLTVYEPRGTYQLSVRQMRVGGIGALQQQFEMLKSHLRAEGLFDQDRKRAIPHLPKCVGVITSPQGAAIRDFLQIINRRFSNIQVKIIPAAVQGKDASYQLMRAIQWVNAQELCDVLIVTRGGGSLEDLWAFNEEKVARAVATSAIPIISAVGHEVDFTICDFVADMRVPTPSAAAELVVAEKSQLSTRITTAKKSIYNILQYNLSELRRRVERAANHPVFSNPAHSINLYQQRVDENRMRLGNSITITTQRCRSKLENLQGRIAALNPKQVLNRGYAYLVDPQNNRVINESNKANKGQILKAILSNGELELSVRAITQKEKVND